MRWLQLDDWKGLCAVFLTLVAGGFRGFSGFSVGDRRKMSFTTKHSELQANNAVNSLLSSILPGARRLPSSSEGRRSTNPRNVKGSKAQLIDRNLKMTVEMQERNVDSLKKRQSKVKKRAVKAKKTEKDKLQQLAKLSVLERHKLAGTLTVKEQKYLNKLVSQNVKTARSWDLEEEDKDELRELQQMIISQTGGASGAKRSQKRRQRVKNFKEDVKAAANDRRYPGLTPGLAPVGLSDEEDSSDED